MMKSITNRVLDAIRSGNTGGTQQKTDTIEETLRREHFAVCKTVRHGFPHQPTCMTYDPVQRLLAIGTRNGSIRIYGRPGVDCSFKQDNEAAIIQLSFLLNQGALMSVCDDDTINLWDFKIKVPKITQSLKLQRERITCIHIPNESNWLYVGTDRGNVHMANIDTFMLSGYIINWNKAIELSRKTHPGPVIHLSDCPIDPNKLLIGFECCTAVLWDLRVKAVEHRYNYTESLRSISWHHEGKQFICSHTDGSLTTWNVKAPAKPVLIYVPHAKQREGKPDPCRPIPKVEWKTVHNGEPYVMFSGGMPYDKSGKTPCLTIINGKSTTVLEMEYTIVDFLTICATPFNNDFQDPSSVVVLLNNDLVVVDLTQQGYPCYENPYPMDIHESPVTACRYYADCPPDLIPAYYSVGAKQTKRSGFSTNEWPVNGGEWGTVTCSYPEIIITGHADGSLKFWDASATNLQILYKVKTAKMFERRKSKSLSTELLEEDPFAIQMIYLCPESRLLAVAGASHVILLKYSRQETQIEIPFVEISIVYEVFDEPDSPDMEFPFPATYKPNMGFKQKSGSNVATNSESKEVITSVKVKTGARKFTPGYQPDLISLLTFVEGEFPGNITSLAINSSYGLLAFGNESGLAVVDYLQRTCLLNMGTPDLYGTMDPYQRVPKSPKNKKNDSLTSQTDECKSPTVDQINGVCISPTNAKQKSRQYPSELKQTKSQDKIDGITFSRSRSSSMSSLDNISQEAIQFLQFAESYTRKTDSFTCPCLWVGTSLGSVLVVVLNLPAADQRLLQPVIVSPSGTIFRMRGAILTMSFLDCNGALVPNISEQWRDQKRPVKSTSRQLSTNNNKLSTSSAEILDKQYAIVCTDKQAMVMTLPSQSCSNKVKLTDTSFATTAEVLVMKESVCLTVYLASGRLMVFSLPSLKPLFELDFLPHTDVRVAKTFTFTNNGHALYMCSPSEIQKLAFSQEIVRGMHEALADLYTEVEMPEAPKQGFFKNLFSGGSSELDREELFGEAKAGKAPTGLYKKSIGSVTAQAGTVASELQKARIGLQERGEKLSHLEDKSAQMMDSAKVYQANAHAIMAKYRDKKWYQL